MKSLFLLAAFSTSLEAQTTNLGFIGPDKAIRLVAKETNTIYFSIELIQYALSPTGLPSTNAFNFYKTNEYILPSDLNFIKPGPVIMGVKSVHSDSVESAISVFTFHILEHKIDGPDAYVVGIPFLNPENNTLTNAIEVIKSNRVIPEAPSPQQGIVLEVIRGDPAVYTATNSILVRNIPKALPASTNETFGTNYINTTKRRNE